MFFVGVQQRERAGEGGAVLPQHAVPPAGEHRLRQGRVGAQLGHSLTVLPAQTDVQVRIRGG